MCLKPLAVSTQPSQHLHLRDSALSFEDMAERNLNFESLIAFLHKCFVLYNLLIPSCFRSFKKDIVVGMKHSARLLRSLISRVVSGHTRTGGGQ